MSSKCGCFMCLENPQQKMFAAIYPSHYQIEDWIKKEKNVQEETNQYTTALLVSLAKII